MVSLVVQIIRFFPSGRSFARYDVSPPRLMLRATDVGRRWAEVVSVHAVMRDTFGMQEISCSILESGGEEREGGDIMEYKNWPRAVFVGRCGGGGS